MKPINVVAITTVYGKNIPYLDDECLRQIALVSPRINVNGTSDLILAEDRGDIAAKEKLDALLAEAEVIFGGRFPQNLISRAPKLKWVQAMSAGVDPLKKTDIWTSPVKLTNVSGIQNTAISEFVLEFMLMFAKQAPLCFQMKNKHEWKRYTPAVLRSKTVGIIGLGSIGREVARLSKAFGMRVIATRRSTKQVMKSRSVDMLLPANKLRDLLSESDFVVLSVPLTSETLGLIGEQEIHLMKPNAYLINIARGSVIDENALIHALESNWIAGAGLDAFAIEPLPPNSKLWDLENVIFSPHVSGNMEGHSLEATKLFCENLKRYINGKKLLNVVDKKKGY